jgi:hypothetical protein
LEATVSVPARRRALTPAVVPTVPAAVAVPARRHRSTPAALAAVTAVLAAAAMLAVAAPAAAAASVGYVRLAHLSPDTPPVDVYLRSQDGAMREQVFPGVGYGQMSDYLSLPVGGYAVAMRQAGAEPASRPVLTTQVVVEEGEAYTVAGVGRFSGLGLRVLSDDLTLPAGNKAKIRIIQASVQAPALDIAVVDGAQIGDAVAFASTTDYREVDAGTWTVRLEPTGGTARPRTVDCALDQGNVYSLLILDGENGALRGELRRDAGRDGPVPQGGTKPVPQGGTKPVPQGGTKPVPRGGTETGAGGTADGTGSDRAGSLAGPLLVLSVGVPLLLAVRRRRAPR